MDLIELREFVLSLPNVEESTPFGDDVLVFKIGGKIFLCVMLDYFERFSVKCDPNTAEELRERYIGVTPAWHFSKKHWNDIYVERGLSEEFMRKQIIHSYELVLSKNVIPKALRIELQKQYQEKLKNY